MPRSRSVNVVLPDEIAARDGLAYSLWLPRTRSSASSRSSSSSSSSSRRGPLGGVVILHGAGSCKESHHDYARVLVAAGFAALAFDARGHGDSDGPLDGRVLGDIGAMAALLRERIGEDAPIALRGSSMGGYLAIVAAPAIAARAIVAICPASGSGLRRGLAAGSLGFDADAPALDEVFAGHDLQRAVADCTMPILLLHAEGDEQVPVQHSRELAADLRHPASRLIVLPGGHHRSIQHDAELQAVSVRFLAHAVRDRDRDRDRI